MEGLLRYDVVLVSHSTDIRTELDRDADVSAWVSRAQTGDYTAFEELMRRYRNDVYRLAYYYVRNREEAWDLSQEVFVKVYRNLTYFRGESSFKTWLLRITTNQCKDWLKRRRINTVAFDDGLEAEHVVSPILGPSQALEAREIGGAIQAAIAKLPHKHRTAFILREFEGLSYEEMAGVMNCSLGTVMSRLHHARKKLQQSLIRMGIVEERNS